MVIKGTSTFIDHGDIINALIATYGKDSDEEYFYFFEECADTGKLQGCTSYEEVEKAILKEYKIAERPYGM